MSTRATYSIAERGYQKRNEWGQRQATFYIHHDGYPEGAAHRFAMMIESKVEPGEEPFSGIGRKNGGWTFAFIRGNDEADMTESHQVHGDTEYRYHVSWADGWMVNQDKQKVCYLHITAEKAVYPYMPGIDTPHSEWPEDAHIRAWKPFFTGDIADFIMKYRSEGWGTPLICVAKEYNNSSKKVTHQYATHDTRNHLIDWNLKKMETFDDKNLNKAVYARKAEMWSEAEIPTPERED